MQVFFFRKISQHGKFLYDDEKKCFFVGFAQMHRPACRPVHPLIFRCTGLHSGLRIQFFSVSFFLSTFKVFFQCNFFLHPLKVIKLVKICRKKQIPLSELSKMLVILFRHFYKFSSVLLLLVGAKKIYTEKTPLKLTEKTYTEKLYAQA